MLLANVKYSCQIKMFEVNLLATAFVLINAEIGSESEVLKDLKAIPEVKSDRD
jgi:hypothetical protein